MKKLVFVLVALLATVHPVSAFDFEVGGVYYNILSASDLTCEVTSGKPKYSGDVVIPSTVTYNGKSYSVTEIGEMAFGYCFSLTSVVIPNSVTKIGWQAFEDCSRLASFSGNFASDDHRCLIVEGVLNSFAPAGLTTYSIPNSVTKIEACAFSDCSSLTSVVIPNSVREIGELAFSQCWSLTSVVIPGSVTKIGLNAFFQCESLTSVEIPNSVSEIGEGAFSGCSSLASFSGKFASDDHRYLVVYGVLNSFAPAGLTTYRIPSSVSEIGGGAFEGCKNLASVEIPNSVSKIGSYAFFDCIGLTSVEIPNSVTTLGLGVFRNCKSLKSVAIPYSVTKIEAQTFSYCKSLESFSGKFASDDHRCLIEDGVLKSFAPAGLTTYSIPNSVTEIEGMAFAGCESLTSVVIPGSVTKIGSSAFSGCEKLTEITSLAVTPPSIKSIAFNRVSKSETQIRVPAGSVEAYRAAEYWGEFKNIVGIGEQ